MRLQAKVWKDGSQWLAEIPLLDAMTQGRSRKEAIAMAADLVESLIDRPHISATVQAPATGGLFELSVSDDSALVGLILRRKRATSGLTLAQVAERLGSSSANSYARYEQGRAQPSLRKLDELLQAVAPERSLVLAESSA